MPLRLDLDERQRRGGHNQPGQNHNEQTVYQETM